MLTIDERYARLKAQRDRTLARRAGFMTNNQRKAKRRARDQAARKAARAHVKAESKRLGLV